MITVETSNNILKIVDDECRAPKQAVNCHLEYTKHRRLFDKIKFERNHFSLIVVLA